MSEILDGRNHYTENCVWDFDVVKNRNTYKVFLPVDKLHLLKFLFEGELKNLKSIDYTEYKTLINTNKMIKRILKGINKALV